MNREIVLFLLLAGPATATPLPQGDKPAAIQEIRDSCMNTQVKHPANSGVPIGIITDYCDCTAETAADRLSIEDVDAMKTGNPSPAAQKIAEAYAHCKS